MNSDNCKHEFVLLHPECDFQCPKCQISITESELRWYKKGLAQTESSPPDDPRYPRARKIERLPPSSYYTVEQALEYVRQSVPNLKDVLVIGWCKDGGYYTVSSHMSREWALWLLHEAKDHVRQVGRYSPLLENGD